MLGGVVAWLHAPWGLSESARHHALEQPMDPLAPHGFVSNPALALTAPVPSGFVATLAHPEERVVTSSESSQVEETTWPRSTRVDGLVAKDLGQGSAGGLGLGTSARTEESRRRDGGDERTVIETWRSHEITGMFATSLSETARLGVLVRYETLAANVAGSYFVNSRERTSYDGTLLTYGLGASLGSKDLVAAVHYVAPPRGSASVLGETWIISDGGEAGLAIAMKLSESSRLGLGATRWLYTTDERARPTTAPDDGGNISLRGVGLGRSYAPIQGISVGVLLGDVRGLALGLSMESIQGVFETNPDRLPSLDGNSPNQLDGLGARLRVVRQEGSIGLMGGVHYEQRDHAWTSPQRTYDYAGLWVQGGVRVEL